jgi:hypothetical protein
MMAVARSAKMENQALKSFIKLSNSYGKAGNNQNIMAVACPPSNYDLTLSSER